ncbi:MAG: hypothetical protein Fur0011_4230 [Candidatus Microgenomates bacterium]
MKNKNHRSGQSILELVIATTLISMGVIAALSLSNQSQKSSNYAKTLDSATAYNNQAADYLRNQKNQLGYATLAEMFTNNSSGGVAHYCLATLPTDSTSFLALKPGTCSDTDLIQGTSFMRDIEVDTSNSGVGTMPITITTSWYDSGIRRATLNMEISQWK